MSSNRQTSRPSQNGIPKVVIPYHVVRAMVDDTIEHPTTETGSTFLGIETPEAMIILGLIPDDNPIRNPGLFGAGGQSQVEIFRWMNRHWEVMRKNGQIPSDYDFPLVFLGDWHKHPGSMNTLSGHDLGRIKDILGDEAQKRTQLVAPIVTHNQYEHHFFMQFDPDKMAIVGQIGEKIQINWFYANRSTRKPLLIQPIIRSSNHFPRLPPVPWHLLDYHQFQWELEELRKSGHTANWMYKKLDDEDILSILIGVDHPTWDKRLLIVTKWDYPKSHAHIQLLAKKEAPVIALPAQPIPEPPVTTNHKGFLGWFSNLFANEERMDTWHPVKHWPKSIVSIVTSMEGELSARSVEPEPSFVATVESSGDINRHNGA